MKKKSVLIAAAMGIMASFFPVGVASAALDIPQGTADCGDINLDGSKANAECKNLTDHSVTAELWVNCKPASPDQHTTQELQPGESSRLQVDCPAPWDHASGGAASVH